MLYYDKPFPLSYTANERHVTSTCAAPLAVNFDAGLRFDDCGATIFSTHYRAIARFCYIAFSLSLHIFIGQGSIDWDYYAAT